MVARMRWLFDNYKWLFDGIGVLMVGTVLTLLGRAIARRQREPVTSVNTVTQSPVNTVTQSPTINIHVPTAAATSPSTGIKPLKFIEPFYYADGDPAPFCSRCWEAHQLQIHLAYVGHMMSGHRYDCPHCNVVYCSSRTTAPR